MNSLLINNFKLPIYLILLLLINTTNLLADEIADRFKYKIGDEISYNIETILPNKAKYVSKSKLLEIIDNEEIWEINNSPSADKRIYDRVTGNWIASFKDGNEIARAIPHNGGLKFPMKKGNKWSQIWTFTAAGGLVSGKSEANYNVKKETIILPYDWSNHSGGIPLNPISADVDQIFYLK